MRLVEFFRMRFLETLYLLFGDVRIMVVSKRIENALFVFTPGKTDDCRPCFVRYNCDVTFVRLRQILY